jgi:hypothetical protein
MQEHLQKIPRAGPEREALREKGQFWTPDWVAEAMVAYVAREGCEAIFDPATGAGAFFLAAKKLAAERDLRIGLLGTEMDPQALDQARENGLTATDLANVEVRDFLLSPPPGPFNAIVANPPYIRHHRLPPVLKAQLRSFGARLLGRPLDGRAGIHVYFLLRALQLLGPHGRLAFIMPADTCEGVFSRSLWNWITRRYSLEAVVTFAPQASPFPNVDTNALIFMISNSEPKDRLFWIKCKEGGTRKLKDMVLSGFAERSDEQLWACHRELGEALATGLSRDPREKHPGGPVLGDFAAVLRGIATGANEFFFLTAGQAAELGLPPEFLVPAIGRTRDVTGSEIRPDSLDKLRSAGRPTLLFSPDGRPIQMFPEAVQQYLRKGEANGLNGRPLIAGRRPWYKMEARAVPPILFAYLGRRNARFIRNLAGVVPLTGFLCVYPKYATHGFVDRLWTVLQSPQTIRNLTLVGKSYGAGAIKVEPRALEKLLLPERIVSAAGLDLAKSEQLQFF